MSIQSEINRITGSRDQSFTALSNKGVTIPSGSSIDDLPGYIAALPETIKGAGVPTTSTAGLVGQHYFNTSATESPYEYVCTDITGGVYTWEPIGAKGDKGDPGVHVGPSAPTDPDVNVWLDTDEPGQTVVTSVNGMSGAVTVREPGLWTRLTTTYTSNSYVSETAFNRISAFSNGEIVVLVINLNVDSTPGATFRTIGQINFPGPLMGSLSLTVASQSGGANMLISIAYDTGVVQIYNAYGSSATGFYRTTAVMPLVSAFE